MKTNAFHGSALIATLFIGLQSATPAWAGGGHGGPPAICSDFQHRPLGDRRTSFEGSAIVNALVTVEPLFGPEALGLTLRFQIAPNQAISTTVARAGADDDLMVLGFAFSENLQNPERLQEVGHLIVSKLQEGFTVWQATETLQQEEVIPACAPKYTQTEHVLTVRPQMDPALIARHMNQVADLLDRNFGAGAGDNLRSETALRHMADGYKMVFWEKP